MARQFTALSREVIGGGIAVHRALGPGLLESVYRRCLVHELRLRRLDVVSELHVSLDYSGLFVEHAYRLDVLVEGLIVVEVKAVRKLTFLDRAQLNTHMKLATIPTGMLMNFNVLRLPDGLITVHR